MIVKDIMQKAVATCAPEGDLASIGGRWHACSMRSRRHVLGSSWGWVRAGAGSDAYDCHTSVQQPSADFWAASGIPI